MTEMVRWRRGALVDNREELLALADELLEHAALRSGTLSSLHAAS